MEPADLAPRDSAAPRMTGLLSRPANDGATRDADALLLWTGGWDSTFRLLQLMAETAATVQPIYVIDRARQSTEYELGAIAAISRVVRESIATADRRLLSPRLYPIEEIAPDPSRNAALAALRLRSHLGGQYVWLSNLAYQLGRDDLELAIHRDDMAYAVVADFLEPHEDPVVGTYHRLATDAPEELALFRCFRLPLVGWTKVQMREWASARGLVGVLEQTWFCHSPVRGQPCGVCNPCCYAMAEGMSYRLSRGARLRYVLRPLVRGRAAVARGVRRIGRAAARARALAGGNFTSYP